MKRAAMTWAASAFGLVVFLLSAPVVQGQDGWKVTYSSTEFCASEGSAVEICCTYTYPHSGDYRVEDTFWVSEGRPFKYKKLRNMSVFAGRLQELCHGNKCTVRISDLRQNDSGLYYFRIITNHKKGKYTGRPGVTLSVTVLQVQVITSTVQDSSTEAELRCLSSCGSAARRSYVWFKNGQNVKEDDSYRVTLHPGDAITCALKGQENYTSASVYAPDVPSVSVSPSGHIVENRSVILTCSSDANPAANYTWYRRDSHPGSIHEGPQLVLSSILSSDSGQFYCAAENELGRTVSQYAPDVPSVSVSPSGHIVEGSSVTLTCSSDANPAANYIWYKDDEKIPKASGQNFTISDVRAQHSGNYCCEARNSRGRRNSTLYLSVAEDFHTPPTSHIIGLSSIVLLVILVVVVVILLLIRKKSSSKHLAETNDSPDQREQRGFVPPRQQDELHYASVHFMKHDMDPVSSAVTAAADEHEVLVYAAVRCGSRAPRSVDNPSALYSNVSRGSRM